MNWAITRTVLGLMAFLPAHLSRANDAPAALNLFAPSPVTLAQPTPKPIGSNLRGGSNLVELSVSTPKPDKAMLLYIQRYEEMNGRPFLAVPEKADQLGGFAGFLRENILNPVCAAESVKFHRVTLSGGVIGAIKHGNPLYLINPLVFSLDW